ncbi:NAC transcription factor 25-like [Olea europaea var. sylvestris]|uniref:NAC transcription factor 29-like n=1 Tax=Olea europaea subsp. europaea TaxID=158383 RepID=A0A8S0Q121_OLEEU|nr:NAC transcription factor 25-like [Olea europaea var. sylvestris]CAA2959899.1 NAC transcription factor 29-like [Olea europaea subsp. europaea]
MNFPPGYRFQPTDQELIIFYLEKKAKNLPLPWNCSIVERDLYGEHATPWNVFSDNDPWDISITSERDRKKSTKMTLYVFTKLLKFGKKRTERRAGCGTWDGQTGAKIIENWNGEIIGSSKMLSFEAKIDSDVIKKNHGHWIMHEYSLDGVSLNERTCKDYVICKITKILTVPRDQPVFQFADEIRTVMRGGENTRINKELVEDCPRANKKQKVEDPLMDDMQEVFGSLDPLLPEIEDFCFEFPVTG